MKPRLAAAQAATCSCMGTGKRIVPGRFHVRGGSGKLPVDEPSGERIRTGGLQVGEEIAQ